MAQTAIAKEGDRVFHVWWGAGTITKLHPHGIIQWRSDAGAGFLHMHYSLNLLVSA